MAKVAGCGCWDCPTLARCLARMEAADVRQQLADVHARYARDYPAGMHSDAQRAHAAEVAQIAGYGSRGARLLQEVTRGLPPIVAVESEEDRS